MNYVTRIKVGAMSLLALTALLNNLSYLRANREVAPKAAVQGEITIYERRFDELKKWLPEHGVVGYVSDETDAIKETESYYLTQYALAPLVVVRGADRPLVVGNFGHGGQVAPVANLKIVKDFGNGVVLFETATR